MVFSFSPSAFTHFLTDFDTVAAGDQEGNIHIIAWKEPEEKESKEEQDDLEEPQGTWKVMGSCQGHKGRVSALDWSSDLVGNQYILRSTSDATELIYCEYTRFPEKSFIPGMI